MLSNCFVLFFIYPLYCNKHSQRTPIFFFFLEYNNCKEIALLMLYSYFFFRAKKKINKGKGGKRKPGLIEQWVNIYQ